MKRFCAAAVLFFLVFMFGCKSEINNSVVEYSGGNLTSEDLVAHGKRMKQMKAFRNSNVSAQDVLEHAVNMEMIIAKGLEKKLHLDPRIRAELHEHMSSVFLKVLAIELVPEINRDTITDKEVEDYFIKNKNNYIKEDRYVYSLIKAQNNDKWEKEVRRINTGNLNPESIYDKDTVIKKGPVKKSELPPLIKVSLLKMKQGEAFGPVSFDDGIKILYLNKIIKSRPFKINEKMEYVRNDVLYSKYRSAWQKTYDDLRRNYKVKVDKEKFEEFKKQFMEN